MKGLYEALLEDLPREAWGVPTYMTNAEAAAAFVRAVDDGRAKSHIGQHGILIARPETAGAWPIHLLVDGPRWLRSYRAEWNDFLLTSWRQWGQPSLMARVHQPALRRVVRELGFLEVPSSPGLAVWL